MARLCAVSLLWNSSSSIISSTGSNPSLEMGSLFAGSS